MKIITTGTADSISVDLDFDAPSHRRCGGCVLCCKLLPIAQLRKPAGKACPHQRTGKGCAIYHERPMECASWACRWLAAEDETRGMRRPDRAHYCIDGLLDELRFVPEDGGEPIVMACLQVWMDPAFPEAAHDPALRAYLARMAAEYHVAALLRWSSRIATAVFAPALNADGEWHEQTSECVPGAGLFGQLPKSTQERLT